MKAMVIENFGDIDRLHLEDLPSPQPADNEVLIKVRYAAVNPVDWKIRQGKLKDRIPHEFPIILGWDASGEIAAIGKQVKKFKPGDRVFAYCRKPIVKWGTYAEFVVFDAANVALMPQSINFAQAASIPLAGLTAWQALFDFAKLQKQERILIHAGAGGVGGLAIAFAKNAGARVYTTARKENHEYVKKLGADVAIDYEALDFVKAIQAAEPDGLDVVFDTIGGRTLQASLALLKPNGRVVSIVETMDPETAKKHNVQFSYVFVAPNGDQLKKIADLVDEKKVLPPNIQEMPLAEAAIAHEKSQGGHTKGKIVLKI